MDVKCSSSGSSVTVSAWSLAYPAQLEPQFDPVHTQKKQVIYPFKEFVCNWVLKWRRNNQMHTRRRSETKTLFSRSRVPSWVPSGSRTHYGLRKRLSWQSTCFILTRSSRSSQIRLIAVFLRPFSRGKDVFVIVLRVNVTGALFQLHRFFIQWSINAEAARMFVHRWAPDGGVRVLLSDWRWRSQFELMLGCYWWD